MKTKPKITKSITSNNWTATNKLGYTKTFQNKKDAIKFTKTK